MVGVARKLPASQKSSALDLELPVMSMEAAALARLLRDHRIDVVVNCLGVLQDGPGSDTAVVHSRFRRAVVAGDPREQPGDPAGAYLDSRHDRDRPNRLQHHQARGRAVDRGIRRTFHDPAAGLRGGACGLWRQRHGALAGGVSARSAGRRTGRAIPAGRHGGYCRDHRLACRARSRRGERRDMGPDAGAAGHARRRDRSIPPRCSAPANGRASRCRRSCSISAPGSAISRTCSAGCRRCEPRR